MNVLSLFDGISCGQVALNRANIEYNNYYASEIKDKAIKVTQNNFPDTIQLGDVKNINCNNLQNINLLLGGSPCQDLSIGNQERNGLKGDKSSLFFYYVKLKNKLKPKYFLFENVKMPYEDKKIITNELGVEPIKINSIDFSYQLRERLYWTNIPILDYESKNINFQNYKSKNYDYCKKFKVNKTPSRIKMWKEKCPNVTNRKYINCLTTKQDRWNNSGLIEFEDFCRFLTTEELEQAQNLPKGYTKGLSIRQAENVLGDGWTVDVIAHILKGINYE